MGSVASGPPVTLAGGVWADRLPRRAVMISADVVLLTGPISDAIGVEATLILAGTLMCVPNFLVLVLLPEVRNVQRRIGPEPELEPDPALLSAL